MTAGASKVTVDWGDVDEKFKMMTAGERGMIPGGAAAGLFLDLCT
jgi:hypothetical protein